MSAVIGFEVVSYGRHAAIENDWDGTVRREREAAEKSAAEANADERYGGKAGVDWFVVELRTEVSTDRADGPPARAEVARLRAALDEIAADGGPGGAGRMRKVALAALDGSVSR